MERRRRRCAAPQRSKGGIPEARREVATASGGHVGELRQVEPLLPAEAALGEHLELRGEAPWVVQASDLNEERAGEGPQIPGVEPRATVRAEHALERLSGVGDVAEPLRGATQECEVALGHREIRRSLTPGRLLAVEAMANGDEGRLCVELELHGTAGTSPRVRRHDTLLLGRQPLMNPSRSALITSACVVGMPC